ncbi:MAG: hypothetical protein FWF59_11685 [Turicibacter sp.]|nr:hypothetical protein [Turicibacter sp.]
MGIATELALKAVRDFKIQDSLIGWGEVIKGDSDQNNKLWKSINLRVQHGLKNIDPNAFRTSDNATKTTVIIKPNVTSLDQVLSGEEGNSSTIADTISEGNRLISPTSITEDSPLMAWLEAMGSQVFTQKQLAHLEKCKGGDFSDRNGYMKRIREKAQNFQLPSKHTTYEEKLLEKSHFFETFLQVLDTEHEGDLLQWFKDNLQIEWFDDFLMEKIGAKDYRKFRKHMSKEILLPSLVNLIAKQIKVEQKYIIHRLEDEKKISPKVDSGNPKSSVTTQKAKISPKTVRRRLMPNGMEIDEEEFL